MQRIIIIDDANCKPALEKFLSLLKENVQFDISVGNNPYQKQLLLESIRQHPTQKKIPLKSDGSLYLLESDNIIRLEAVGSKSIIFQINQAPIEVLDHLDDLQYKFCKEGFLRVHSNHIVNIAFVVKLQFGENPFLELNTDETIPVDISAQQDVGGNLENMLQSLLY